MKRFWLFAILLALSAAVLAVPMKAMADEEEVNEAMGLLSSRLGNVENTLKLKISGDIRVRGEYFYQDYDTVYNSAALGIKDRYRTRIRARLGLSKKIGDDLSAYAALATGQVLFGAVTLTDPASTNQTLTGDGSTKNFNLDKAAIEFSPGFLENKLTLVGGKMNNPLSSTAITWDGDVNPEGFAIKAAPVAGTNFNFLYFILQENSSAPEAYLAAAQLSQDFMVGDANCSFMVGGEVVPNVGGVSGYAFMPHTTYVNPVTFDGTIMKNGMVFDASNGNVIPDMVIGEAMLKVKINVGDAKIPVGLTLHGAYNFESFDINGTTTPSVLQSPTYGGGNISNALAMLGKIDIGKADPGMWAGFIEFGMIDPNATFGLFTDSDSGQGFNNNTWVKGNVTLGVTKDMTFGVTQYLDWHTTYDVFGDAYNAALGGTGRTPLLRTQIDAIVKL